MGDIVESSDGVVPVVGPSEAVCAVNLWGEMAEEDDGGLVGADENGADEGFKVFQGVFFSV